MNQIVSHYRIVLFAYIQEISKDPRLMDHKAFKMPKANIAFGTRAPDPLPFIACQRKVSPVFESRHIHQAP